MKCDMPYGAVANLVAAVGSLQNANQAVALAGRDMEVMAHHHPDTNREVADILHETNDTIIRVRQTIQKILEEL